MSAVEKTKPQAGRLRASENVGTSQSSNEAKDTPEISPRLCPRYERCSAPLCPLDKHWQLRTHIKGEPVCGLLLELSKIGGEASLRGCLPSEVVQTLTIHAPGMLARHGPLRRAWEKASKCGSKLQSGIRLREMTGEAAND